MPPRTKGGARKPAKKASRKPAKKASRKPAKKASRKPAKKAARKPAKKAPRKPAKKAPAKPAKKAPAKPARRAGARRPTPSERSVGSAEARPFWSGTVTFGLVSIPVDLYPANRPRRAGLRMLSDAGTPLRREYQNADTGRAVENADVVRGFEVEKGEFVVLTDEELESAEPERTRDIALDAFVDLDELDPMFFDRAYFLAPQANAGKAYRLLSDVMEQNGLAGIARFVMRSKEYLVAIMAEDGILRAETMRFADEVRKPEEVGLPEPKQAKAPLVREMTGAIRALASDRLPEDTLQDAFLAELRRIAEAKAQRGVDVVQVSESEEDADAPGVIDLMDALRRSMEGARVPRAGGARKRG